MEQEKPKKPEIPATEKPRPWKCTKTESRRRQTILMEMLLDGASRSDMVEYAGKNWKIRAKAVDKYIGKINAEFKDTPLGDSESLRTEAIQRAKRLFARCLEKRDFKTASSVLREMNDIYGVKVVKFQGSVDNKTSLDNLTVDQLFQIKEIMMKGTPDEKAGDSNA